MKKQFKITLLVLILIVISVLYYFIIDSETYIECKEKTFDAFLCDSKGFIGDIRIFSCPCGNGKTKIATDFILSPGAFDALDLDPKTLKYDKSNKIYSDKNGIYKYECTDACAGRHPCVIDPSVTCSLNILKKY
ncbi:MAG: hypothetical protein WCK11_00230 [Candidatus Falkowbacteria bacterium]